MLVDRRIPKLITKTDYIRHYKAFLACNAVSQTLYVQNDMSSDVVYLTIDNNGDYTNVQFSTYDTFDRFFNKDCSIILIDKNTIKFEKVSYVTYNDIEE